MQIIRTSIIAIAIMSLALALSACKKEETAQPTKEEVTKKEEAP